MKKEYIPTVIKLSLLCVVLLILYYCNVVQLLKAGYFEIQKAAYEGKDVHGLISSVLALVSFSGVLLRVLFFMFSPHSKPGSLISFLFVWLFLMFVLIVLNNLYKSEIANYLKSTYQPEPAVYQPEPVMIETK